MHLTSKKGEINFQKSISRKNKWRSKSSDYGLKLRFFKTKPPLEYSLEVKTKPEEAR